LESAVAVCGVGAWAVDGVREWGGDPRKHGVKQFKRAEKKKDRQLPREE